jgi:hypothetical protein
MQNGDMSGWSCLFVLPRPYGHKGQLALALALARSLTHSLSRGLRSTWTNPGSFLGGLVHVDRKPRALIQWSSFYCSVVPLLLFSSSSFLSKPRRRQWSVRFLSKYEQFIESYIQGALLFICHKKKYIDKLLPVGEYFNLLTHTRSQLLNSLVPWLQPVEVVPAHHQ